MAFRTGSYVASLADRLSPPIGKSESWTYVVSGAKEDDAKVILADFHKTEVRRPPETYIYIPTASDDEVRQSP